MISEHSHLGWQDKGEEQGPGNFRRTHWKSPCEKWDPVEQGDWAVRGRLATPAAPGDTRSNMHGGNGLDAVSHAEFKDDLQPQRHEVVHITNIDGGDVPYVTTIAPFVDNLQPKPHPVVCHANIDGGLV